MIGKIVNAWLNRGLGPSPEQVDPLDQPRQDEWLAERFAPDGGLHYVHVERVEQGTYRITIVQDAKTAAILVMDNHQAWNLLSALDESLKHVIELW